MPETNNANNNQNTNQGQQQTDPGNNQSQQNQTPPAANPQNQQNVTPPQNQEPPAQKMLTQEQVNAIAAREKAEGRKAILNQYGLTEEQLAGIAQIIKPQEQQQGAAVTPAVNPETMIRLLKSEAKAELAVAGVRADKVDAMITLVTDKLDVNNYTQDQIKEAIKDVKTMFAESFSTQTDLNDNKSGNKNNATGTGGNFAGSNQAAQGASNGSGGFSDPESIGKMLAERKIGKKGN